MLDTVSLDQALRFLHFYLRLDHRHLFQVHSTRLSDGAKLSPTKLQIAVANNMASHAVPGASLIVTEAEAGALALYDQLQQLQLELALLRSQRSHHASG